MEEHFMKECPRNNGHQIAKLRGKAVPKRHQEKSFSKLRECLSSTPLPAANSPAENGPYLVRQQKYHFKRRSYAIMCPTQQT